MKKIFTFVTTAVFLAGVFQPRQADAQSPEKMSYQAIVRDAGNNLVTSTSVGMQISIIQGTPGGLEVYVETHSPNTNANGLVNIEIGSGTIVSGDFSTIDWANGPYFLKTETDPTGGATYTITGTSQLLSVPYAFHAKTAENVTGTITETDPVFGASVASSIIAADVTSWNNKLDTETQNIGDVLAISNLANTQIKNVTDPTESQDAATKAYVDNVGDIISNVLLDAGLNGVAKDIDGNSYRTIKIGTQVWITENLKTTKFSNGALIPLVTDTTAWSNLVTSGYCWYDNDSVTYASTYGALYNWYAVNSGNLCPTGWHVPTDAEWTLLIDSLGGDSIAGSKLKEAGTTHWDIPNTDATNETGFTALPGGTRYSTNGGFAFIGNYGYWWSSTESSPTVARSRNMSYVDSIVNRVYYNKARGLSVRCLKD